MAGAAFHHVVNVGRLSLGFSGVFQCLGWGDGFWEEYHRGEWRSVLLIAQGLPNK